MKDHAHLRSDGMIKLPPSSPVAAALETIGVLPANRVLPEHVVYSLGARLYYVGGRRKREEEENERKRAKAEEHIKDVTDPDVARAIAQTALDAAAELERQALERKAAAAASASTSAAMSSSSAPGSFTTPVTPSPWPPPPVLAVVGNGVEIRRSQTGFGLGLFATRDFAKGEPITAYTGKLVSHETARKLPHTATTHMRSHVAMTWALDGLFLPSGIPITNPPEQLRGRGGAAMVNDARGTEYSNNAEFTFYDSQKNSDPWVKDPKERITYLVATEPIPKGKEIFTSYGRDYWTKRQ